MYICMQMRLESTGYRGGALSRDHHSFPQSLYPWVEGPGCPQHLPGLLPCHSAPHTGE